MSRDRASLLDLCFRWRRSRLREGSGCITVTSEDVVKQPLKARREGRLQALEKPGRKDNLTRIEQGIRQGVEVALKRLSDGASDVPRCEWRRYFKVVDLHENGRIGMPTLLDVVHAPV